MKYPINADEYIAEARRAGFTVTDRNERLHRETCIPLVNGAYQDGREGSGDYPLAAAEGIAYIERKKDRKLTERSRQVIQTLVKLCNAAYAQGQQDAKEGRE